MQKIYLLALVVASLACSENDTQPASATPHEAPYVGTFECSYGPYTITSLPTEFRHREGLVSNHLYNEQDYRHTIILNADKTYNRTVFSGMLFSASTEGTWTIDGDKLVANLSGTEQNDVFTITSFAGDNLMVEFDLDVTMIPDAINDTLQIETRRQDAWFQATKATIAATFHKVVSP
jgi:hypothetical protein